MRRKVDQLISNKLKYFIHIINRSVVLVKTQDEIISSNSDFFSTHPLDSENLLQQHPSLFSLLFCQKEETFSYKNPAFPCALIDASGWFPLQQLVFFPRSLPSPWAPSF